MWQTSLSSPIGWRTLTNKSCLFFVCGIVDVLMATLLYPMFNCCWSGLSFYRPMHMKSQWQKKIVLHSNIPLGIYTFFLYYSSTTVFLPQFTLLSTKPCSYVIWWKLMRIMISAVFKLWSFLYCTNVLIWVTLQPLI